MQRKRRLSKRYPLSAGGTVILRVKKTAASFSQMCKKYFPIKSF
jgi:hypothetical protein